MGAFSCFITLGVLVHLISCDVSLTIGSNRPNVKSAQPVRSNYYQSQSQPQGYDYSGSYSTVSPENKAQYVAPASSKTSYDPYPSGQVSSEQRYFSAKQEYNPQYQNDRGVTLISKELQVPFVSSKGKSDSDGCDDTNDSKVNEQVQNTETYKPDDVNNVNQQVQNSEPYQPDVENDEAYKPVIQSDETSKPVIKTSNYEVRRPGIRKEFYDIEEKVVIRPAGTAIFELQHDKPHSSQIVNKHISQQRRVPSQYSDYQPQYYPQQYANHGYNPVITQSPNGYDYNPVVVQSPPQYPNTGYPGYPSTSVTPQYVPPQHVPPQYVPPQYVPPQYVPPVTGGYLPPCDDTPGTPSAPQPPSHEFSEEQDDEHDYDSDAAYINPQKEDNKEYVDVVYSPSKSNSNRNREDYRSPQSSVYNGADYKIDRVRHEYQNQRGDLAQQKASQYPQQFHQEYVPNENGNGNGNVNVNQRKVQIRPNGAPPAKYSQDKGLSQVEIENSQRLLDLYSANGDVTEIGFNGNVQSQQYQTPNNYQSPNNYQTPNNVAQARVVSVTPAPKYADYVDEQTKSRRVVLSKPLYTVQRVEVHEHSHRLTEDIPSDSVEPKVSEFEKLRIIGTSSGKTSSVGQGEVNKEVEYVTPVPQEYGQLRAGTPVPDNLQK